MKDNVKNIKIKIGALAIASIAFISSAHASNPATLQQLKDMKLTALSDVEQALANERDVRARAMREAAHSYGARSGLIYRTHEIRVSLEKMGPYLDVTYNFTPLLLTDFQDGEVADKRERFIIPPIISEMGRTFNQTNDTVIRQRDKVLRIDRNAVFSPSAPNWRAYLLTDIGEKKPALPHASLMPRTGEERDNWNKWLEEGWSAGRNQADEILKSDQARLLRDYEGMVRYHELVDQKIVSLPFVATRNDGVTGDKNQLNVNDVTLQISVMPEFDKKTDNWKPTLAK